MAWGAKRFPPPNAERLIKQMVEAEKKLVKAVESVPTPEPIPEPKIPAWQYDSFIFRWVVFFGDDATSFKWKYQARRFAKKRREPVVYVWDNKKKVRA
jgi:hypothetical protein